MLLLFLQQNTVQRFCYKWNKTEMFKIQITPLQLQQFAAFGTEFSSGNIPRTLQCCIQQFSDERTLQS